MEIFLPFWTGDQFTPGEPKGLGRPGEKLGLLGRFKGLSFPKNFKVGFFPGAEGEGKTQLTFFGKVVGFYLEKKGNLINFLWFWNLEKGNPKGNFGWPFWGGFGIILFFNRFFPRAFYLRGKKNHFLGLLVFNQGKPKPLTLGAKLFVGFLAPKKNHGLGPGIFSTGVFRGGEFPGENPLVRRKNFFCFQSSPQGFWG